MKYRLTPVLTCLTIMMGSASKADSNSYYPSQLECLATNIYHEARGEDFTGKLAVGFTTKNRAENELFPDTICDVVWQPYQFSWTADPKNIDKSDTSWSMSVAAALLVMNETIDDPTNGALFFHSDDISRPKWTKDMKITLRHGGHIFYTLK